MDVIKMLLAVKGASIEEKDTVRLGDKHTVIEITKHFEFHYNYLNFPSFMFLSWCCVLVWLHSIGSGTAAPVRRSSADDERQKRCISYYTDKLCV